LLVSTTPSMARLSVSPKSVSPMAVSRYAWAAADGLMGTGVVIGAMAIASYFSMSIVCDSMLRVACITDRLAE
jgi:hypothetical protein